MRFLGFVLGVLLSALPATGQDWSGNSSDSGALVHGWTRDPGNTLRLYCNAPSTGGRRLIDVGDHETRRSQPFAIFFELGSTQLVATDINDQNANVTVFVDQTGYRLPPVVYDEFYGGWTVELSMSDPMMLALLSAQMVMLDLGNGTRRALPVAGLTQRLDAAMRACINAWAVQGQTIPVGLDRFWPNVGEGAVATPVPARPAANGIEVQLPAQIANYLSGRCGAGFQIPPFSMNMGNLDGDGHPDFVLAWRDMICPNLSISSYCGASDCAIDLFLSSRGYSPLTDALLGMSVGLVPLANGRDGIGLSASYTICSGDGVCDNPFYWDGRSLRQYPN